MRRLSLVFGFLGSAAWAQEPQYLSGDGVLFDYTLNRHGVVLTAREKADGIFLDTDSSDPVARPGDVVYLGRACDAFSETLGEGRWSATEGRFRVSFHRAELAFPGQDIDAGHGVRCPAQS